MPKPARTLPPLDPPMVPYAVAGTLTWAVVGLVLLAAGAPERWLWTCLAGVLVGLVGVVVMVIRQRRRRAHGQELTSSTSPSS